jgi:hypothetical protein
MRTWLTTSCRPVPTATPRTNCRRRTGPDRGTGQPTARIIHARSTATPSPVGSPTPLLRPGRAVTARPPSTRPPRCRTHQGPTSAVRCRNSHTCRSPPTGQARPSPHNLCRRRRTRAAATCPKRPDRRPTHRSTASLQVVPSTANRREDGSTATWHRRHGTANRRRVPSTANRPDMTRRRSRSLIPVPSSASPTRPSQVPSEPTPTPIGKTPTRSATTPTHSAVARTGPVSPATVHRLLLVRHRKGRHRLNRGPTGHIRLRRARADMALVAKPRLLTVLAVSPSRIRSRVVPAPMGQAAPDLLAMGPVAMDPVAMDPVAMDPVATDTAAMDTAAMELARVRVADTDLQATAKGPTAL